MEALSVLLFVAAVAQIAAVLIAYVFIAKLVIEQVGAWLFYR